MINELHHINRNEYPSGFIKTQILPTEQDSFEKKSCLGRINSESCAVGTICVLMNPGAHKFLRAVHTQEFMRPNESCAVGSCAMNPAPPGAHKFLRAVHKSCLWRVNSTPCTLQV